MPTLRPGEVVITDNLGSQKGAAVRQAIETAGAELLFLPTYYSPDLILIENAVSTGLDGSRKGEPKGARAEDQDQLSTSI